MYIPIFIVDPRLGWWEILPSPWSQPNQSIELRFPHGVVQAIAFPYGAPIQN